MSEGDHGRARGATEVAGADPVTRARDATDFFAARVPGQLGCIFDHAAADLVVGHIDVTPNLIAGTGFLFAPAVIALADTCAAIGCGNNIAAGTSFTTIELKANFLSSARVGERVTCRCTPVHLGRQTHVWDATVINETTGRTMALFRCTQMVLAAKEEVRPVAPPQAEGSFAGAAWLAFRSVLWTVLLPGVVAGLVPWWFFGLGDVDVDLQSPVHLLGLLFVGVGAALLATCIWEFAASGRGTLSPVDPPRDLVVRGLYRYVRNPMYLSVSTIVVGEVLLTRSAALLGCWAVWMLGVSLFVMGYEEPTLRRRFGASYERYTAEVGRWLPRLRGRGRTP